MKCAVVFPTAVAQLVATRLNNTLFAADQQTRVRAVTAQAIKFDLIDRGDLDVIDPIVDQNDGSYVSDAAIRMNSLSSVTESV